MNILVVGGGGREHALVWKIAQSPLVEKIYCAPGNPGIAQLADCVHIDADDIEGLCEFAQAEQVDLTVVGPEVPLTLGIVDHFQAAGLAIFGPTQKAAQIEGSKRFSKELMERYQIPTAAYRSFTDHGEAVAHVKAQGAPIVIKANGLAAGKGVVVAMTEEQALAALEDMMLDRVFGEAGNCIVIEEYMDGEEASFFAFTDGKSILPLASSQDHKRVHDQDQGPNTGGMGAYSPAPVVTAELHQRIVDTIVKPTIEGMARDGCPYSGILYVGLMIKGGEPRVVEFNARFGDPEAQPLLMRMKSDIVPILAACARSELGDQSIEWHDKAAVCVVMASGGYPADYVKGLPILGLEDVAAMEDVMVFHAGTGLEQGKIVNYGGRVLGVTGLGSTVLQAINNAYQAVEKIHWDNVHYRRDIGARALQHSAIAGEKK